MSNAQQEKYREMMEMRMEVCTMLGNGIGMDAEAIEKAYGSFNASRQLHISGKLPFANVNPLAYLAFGGFKVRNTLTNGTPSYVYATELLNDSEMDYNEIVKQAKYIEDGTIKKTLCSTYSLDENTRRYRDAEAECVSYIKFALDIWTVQFMLDGVGLTPDMSLDLPQWDANKIPNRVNDVIIYDGIADKPLNSQITADQMMSLIGGIKVPSVEAVAPEYGKGTFHLTDNGFRYTPSKSWDRKVNIHADGSVTAKKINGEYQHVDVTGYKEEIASMEANANGVNGEDAKTKALAGVEIVDVRTPKKGSVEDINIEFNSDNKELNELFEMQQSLSNEFAQFKNHIERTSLDYGERLNALERSDKKILKELAELKSLHSADAAKRVRRDIVNDKEAVKVVEESVSDEVPAPVPTPEMVLEAQAVYVDNEYVGEIEPNDINDVNKEFSEAFAEVQTDIIGVVSPVNVVNSVKTAPDGHDVVGDIIEYELETVDSMDVKARRENILEIVAIGDELITEAQAEAQAALDKITVLMMEEEQSKKVGLPTYDRLGSLELAEVEIYPETGTELDNPYSAEGCEIVANKGIMSGGFEEIIYAESFGGDKDKTESLVAEYTVLSEVAVWNNSVSEDIADCMITDRDLHLDNPSEFRTRLVEANGIENISKTHGYLYDDNLQDVAYGGIDVNMDKDLIANLQGQQKQIHKYCDLLDIDATPWLLYGELDGNLMAIQSLKLIAAEVNTTAYAMTIVRMARCFREEGYKYAELLTAKFIYDLIKTRALSEDKPQLAFAIALKSVAFFNEAALNDVLCGVNKFDDYLTWYDGETLVTLNSGVDSNTNFAYDIDGETVLMATYISPNSQAPFKFNGKQNGGVLIDASHFPDTVSYKAYKKTINKITMYSEVPEQLRISAISAVNRYATKTLIANDKIDTGWFEKYLETFYSVDNVKESILVKEYAGKGMPIMNVRDMAIAARARSGNAYNIIGELVPDNGAKINTEVLKAQLDESTKDYVKASYKINELSGDGFKSKYEVAASKEYLRGQYNHAVKWVW